MTERECLLQKIRVAFFAAHDTVLFLNTHPHCKEAIADHKKYVSKLKDLRDEYTKKYGMLDHFSESDPHHWSWIDDPWPWQ